MPDNIKKRIAKNTAYLYANSIVSLVVGLYTSRVLLQTLGIEDFGLYGAVGSIVSMLGFLNISLGSASSRYLTYELVNGSERSQAKVFSTVFLVHLFFAIIIFILAETLGLWYVYNKLEIPKGRFDAAMLVYQSSIGIGIINIIQVPYYALITAHEKMSFSSIWNIATTIFKLILIVLLYWITFDRLKYYALSIFSVYLITIIGVVLYCKRSFKECHFIYTNDKNLLKGILSFAGYSAFSSSSTIIRTQGNVLFINKFFGVSMNAAASVANGVIGYSTEFAQNVINAFRPQIIKTYAQNDIRQMEDDIVSCIKYCVAIFYLITIPLSIEIEYILRIWLSNVPQYSGILCRIGLIGSLLSLVNMIMTIAIQATSKVRNNSLIISLASILSLFVTYLILKIGGDVTSVFIIYSLTQLMILTCTIINTKQLIPEIRIKRFLTIFTKVSIIALLSLIPSALLRLEINTSFFRFIIVSFIFIVFFILSFYKFMLNKEEKKMIITKILKKRP